MPYDKTLEHITYFTYSDEVRDVYTICRVCWNITRHVRKVNYVKIKSIPSVIDLSILFTTTYTNRNIPVGQFGI